MSNVEYFRKIFRIGFVLLLKVDPFDDASLQGSLSAFVAQPNPYFSKSLLCAIRCAVVHDQDTSDGEVGRISRHLQRC